MTSSFHSKPRIRASLAQYLPQALGFLDIDADTFFAAEGFGLSAFDGPDNFLDFAELADLMSRASSIARCPYLGLSIGMYGRIVLHNSQNIFEMDGATVSDAMGVMIESYRYNDQGGWADLVASTDGVTIRYIVCDPRVGSAAQITLMAIAFFFAVMRTLCGQNWSPDCVELPMRRLEDEGPLRRFFRCAIRYDQPAAQIKMQAEVLSSRLAPSAIKAIADSAIDLIPIDLAEDLVPPQDISDEFTSLVVRRLLAGKSILANAVSTELTLTRRTLHRRLKRDGLRYRELRQNALAGLAKRLLYDTALPVTELAILLGYSELSAFTRAFTAWQGQSPVSYKKNCHNRLDNRGREFIDISKRTAAWIKNNST